MTNWNIREALHTLDRALTTHVNWGIEPRKKNCGEHYDILVEKFFEDESSYIYLLYGGRGSLRVSRRCV